MPENGSKKAIGYILRKFPVLSETFILNEILELEAQGYAVHIFSIERPNDPRFHHLLHKLKANVTYIPDLLQFKSLWRNRKKAAQQFAGYKKALGYTLKKGDLAFGLRFLQSCYVANEVKKKGIGHLHAHFATRSTSVAFLASLITGLPYSFTAHAVDIFKDSLCKNALKRKIDYADFVVTVSDFNMRYLCGISKEAETKCIKVNNGIDLTYFTPGAEKNEALFTFLTVARLVEKKGHATLVAACEILRNQGYRFQCLLVGKGKLEGDVKQMIREKQLEECVKVLGAHTQNEVLERFRQADAFVLPCTTGPDGNKDGLPVSIVEALACGLPVITTPMTGNTEVVIHEENGLLVAFDNPEETAEAMKRLINDSLLYAKLSGNARNSVAEAFDKTTTVKSLAARFEENLL